MMGSHPLDVSLPDGRKVRGFLLLCPSCGFDLLRFIVVERAGDASHNHLVCGRCFEWFCQGGPNGCTPRVGGAQA